MRVINASRTPAASISRAAARETDAVGTDVAFVEVEEVAADRDGDDEEPDGDANAHRGDEDNVSVASSQRSGKDPRSEGTTPACRRGSCPPKNWK